MGNTLNDATLEFRDENGFGFKACEFLIF